MDKAQFEREKQYGAAIAIAKHLLRRELIAQEEYQKLTEALSQKYRPVVSLPRNPIPKRNGRQRNIRKEV